METRKTCFPSKAAPKLDRGPRVFRARPRFPGEPQHITTSPWPVASSSPPQQVTPRKTISLPLHQVANQVLFSKRQDLLTHQVHISYSLHRFHTAHTITDTGLEQNPVSYQNSKCTDRIEMLSCKEHILLKVKWFINSRIYFRLGPNSLCHLCKYTWRPFFEQKTAQVQLFLKLSKETAGHDIPYFLPHRKDEKLEQPLSFIHLRA